MSARPRRKSERCRKCSQRSRQQRPARRRRTSRATHVKSALLSVCLTASLLAGVAQARECRGVAFPEEIRIGDAALQLNGLGVRKATFLKVNVYVAALYVEHPSSDPAALMQAGADQLTLHFV